MNLNNKNSHSNHQGHGHELDMNIGERAPVLQIWPFARAESTICRPNKAKAPGSSASNLCNACVDR